MASLRTQNALLFVIAVCLVLLVVHVYSDVDLVSKAQASSSGTQAVRLFGCYPEKPPSCVWAAVRIDQDGRLVTAPSSVATTAPTQ